MASLSAFSLSRLVSPFSLSTLPSSALSPLRSQSSCIKLQSQFRNSVISSTLKFDKQRTSRRTIVRAVAGEEETLVPEEESSPPPPDATPEPTVSVAVSPSDGLTMFFQAEGTIVDSAVPAVTKALEEVDGIADLKVQVLEGIASVESTLQENQKTMGGVRVGILGVMWVVLAALAAADGGNWAPAPSPTGSATGGMSSLHTLLLGFAAATMSFFILKELI